MLWYPGTAVEVQLIRDWVIERLDDDEQFADGYPVAIVKPDEDGDAIIRAAMIFANHTGNNVFIAGASDTNGWMSRYDVANVLNTPFRPPMNVLRITALVEETNKRSARLMEAFGFVLEGTLRDNHHEGSRTLVYGLTKSDFLGGRYGRKISSRTESYKPDDGAAVRAQPVRRAVC